MRKCICSGSFDPITYGHLDIIRRAASLFDEVVVVVLDNSEKKVMFPIETRVQMVKEAVAETLSEERTKIQVTGYNGLLADFAKEIKANAIVRGLRNAVDYEYEKQMAEINFRLAKGIETIFLPTEAKYMHISSSFVRVLAKLNADISEYVPKCIYKYFENSTKI